MQIWNQVISETIYLINNSCGKFPYTSPSEYSTLFLNHEYLKQTFSPNYTTDLDEERLFQCFHNAFEQKVKILDAKNRRKRKLIHYFLKQVPPDL